MLRRFLYLDESALDSISALQKAVCLTRYFNAVRSAAGGVAMRGLALVPLV
jgi:hypothetical protein